MLGQAEFLLRYHISPEDFEKSGLLWSDLKLIYNDHVKNVGALETTGNYISERLRKTQGVHSVKQRIKDPEHLIDKIIRKKIENPERIITIECYKTEITDLIGIKALHLFKSDWIPIHDFIIKTWQLREKPTANLRDGDPQEVINVFEDKNCSIKRHPFGYRSVHYLVNSKPTKEECISEVQVRTIFEEGWSEIDHHIRYPSHTNDIVLSQFLVVFNRLAGSADEMGSYIQFLKIALEEREFSHQNEIENRAAVIDRLKEEINDLKIDAKKKEKLQVDIDAISSASKSKERSAQPKNMSKAGQQSKVLNSSWPDAIDQATRLTNIINNIKREYAEKGFLVVEGFWEEEHGFDGDLSELEPGNTLTVKIGDAGTRESIFILYDKSGIPVGMLPGNLGLGINDFMLVTQLSQLKKICKLL